MKYTISSLNNKWHAEISACHGANIIKLQFKNQDIFVPFKSEAVVFIFGPSRTFRKNYPDLKLYGFDKDKKYIVDCNNEANSYEMSGDTLMKLGIPGGLHTVGTLKSKVIHIKKSDS